MKAIEFRTKKEGEELSKAFLTFGKWFPHSDQHRGFYISLCIPGLKLNRLSIFKRGSVLGWYGIRLSAGYYITSNKKIYLYKEAYVDLIKEIEFIPHKEIRC